MTKINDMLWYRQPAACWQQALPLGNGRIGAMVYGGAAHERIDLTESTFVSGEASAQNSQPQADGFFNDVRRALLGRDYSAAEEHAQGMAGLKLNYGTNLPAGRLLLDFDGISEPEGYRRSLDLPHAVSHVKFDACGSHLRECFVSHPDQVFVLRIAGSQCFTIRYDCGECPFANRFEGNDLISVAHAVETNHSDGKSGVTMHLRLRAVAPGGEAEAAESGLHIRPSGEAVLLLAMNTDFTGGNAFALSKTQIEAASARTYDELMQRHADDFGELFNRCTLDLGEGSGLPTDERLAAVRAGADNRALTALMFQYGRYLFIASSREDSPLPANLQGAWNDDIACRMGWTCDMHLDINTEMNYWPAHATGLHECARPLHRWAQRVLMPSGRLTARETYGLDGWVAHTVANAWGFSAPGWSTGWGLHVTGGVWIASHLWEHWLYTGDRAFLRESAYPVLRGAVEFFREYLVDDENTGYLLPLPSYSPENGFLQDGRSYTLSEGATCDILMIRELCGMFEQACAELAVDDELRRAAREMAGRLPPFRVGRHGQLQEWLEDFEESVPNHRHTSHLLGLFPFAQVTPDGTPELAGAARISIDRRTNADAPWEDTGWARSLLILYSARLSDGAAAGRHVLSMQKTLTNPNLLVFSPPVAGAETNVYELDGNTGLAAGIAEMLLQSHGGKLRLLPALPPEWRDGSVAGLCGRGGFVVAIRWKDGKLTEAVVESRLGPTCTIAYEGREIAIRLRKGRTVRLTPALLVDSMF